MKHPCVSVIVVSDYRGGDAKAWNDICLVLQALADQDYREDVEYFLVENEDNLKSMPSDLLGILPGLEIISCHLSDSYAMKNLAAQHAHSELLMVIDADNIPVNGWISAGVEAMSRLPQAVAISGRTTYPGRSLVERVLGLLSRSYSDAGREGPVSMLATNNMIIRRSQLLATPLPEGMGPFAYRLLTREWQRQGLELFFTPGMRVVHDFEGFPMERDVRRGVGWTEIHVRLLDGSIRGAWAVRNIGVLAIPPLVLFRIVDRLIRALPLLSPFGLRRRDIPLVISLAIFVHLLEVPGMIRALRGLNAGQTVYR